MIFEIVLVIFAVAVLAAAHIYVRLHTRKILSMIAEHRAELDEGQQRMCGLLVEIRQGMDGDPPTEHCQPPIVVPTYDTDTIGFQLRRHQ